MVPEITADHMGEIFSPVESAQAEYDAANEIFGTARTKPEQINAIIELIDALRALRCVSNDYKASLEELGLTEVAASVEDNITRYSNMIRGLGGVLQTLPISNNKPPHQS